jgi:ribonuclease HI
MVRVMQINLGRRPRAAEELRARLSKEDNNIVLMQEPPKVGKRRRRARSGKFYGGRYFANKANENRGETLTPRAAIWLNDKLPFIDECMLIQELSDRDVATIIIKLQSKSGAIYKTLLCSMYLPYLDENNKIIKDPSKGKLEAILEFANKEKLSVIIGADCNSHNSIWGSRETNERGNTLAEFIIEKGLTILNDGTTSTFVSGNRESTIDITLVKGGVSAITKNWTVDKSDSMSDHRYISFELDLEKLSNRIVRIKRKTDWLKFRKMVIKKLNSPMMEIKSIEDLEKNANELRERLYDAFTKSCRQKKRKTKFYDDWYTPKLLHERRILWDEEKKVKEAKAKNSGNLEEQKRTYNEMSKKYYKSVTKTQTIDWRHKMEEVERTQDISRIHKLIDKGQNHKVGSIKKGDGSLTHDIIDSLDVLMRAHFPECEEISDPRNESIHKEPITDEAALVAIKNWTSVEKVKWAIDSLKEFKSPGEDGIFPAILHKAGDKTYEILSDLIYNSIRLRHIPETWRGTLVTFIPKDGKDNYEDPKAWRPISLMSFILKTAEKLIDKKIRETELIDSPLDVDQHAYQKGKGCDSALHSLVSRLEQNIENNDITLLIGIDIEGAFDNTRYEVISQALRRKNVDEWTIEWIEAMLANREIKPSMEGSVKRYKPTRGCPQGGCLSPLLWNIAIDTLIVRLKAVGVRVVGYADDLEIEIRGKHASIVGERANQVMRIVEQWCEETGLSVNPSKSSVMKVTRKIKADCGEVRLFGSVIPYMDHIKSLGVIIDNKLNWGKHINYAIHKGKNTLWTARAMVGQKWGLRPRQMLWIVKQIVIPRVTYACIVWWHKTEQVGHKKNLDALLRQALIMVTGAMRTTPGKALNALLNIPPLNEIIRCLAMKTCHRLVTLDLWYLNISHNNFHRSIIRERSKCLQQIESDNSIKEWNANKRYKVIIGEADNWSYGMHISKNQFCWFVDGSQRGERSAIGLYNPVGAIEKGVRISDKSSSTQSEVLAISECANLILKDKPESREIVILSDSQVALRAIDSMELFKTSVKTCAKRLSKLGIHNRVTVGWVPGHKGILGNVRADQIAKQSCDNETIEITTLPSSDTTLRAIEENCMERAKKSWKSCKSQYRHANLFIGGYAQERANQIVRGTRATARILTCIYTGHGPLSNFLVKFKKKEDATCRFCLEEEESMEHILMECEALSEIRRRLLPSARAPTGNETIELEPEDLLKFAHESGLYEALMCPP